MTSHATLVDTLLHGLSDRRLADAEGPLSLSRIQAVARSFERAGIRRRQAVGFSFENGRSCIEAYIGLALLDAVAVPLPPNLASSERAQLWAALDCAHVVTEAGVEPVSAVGERPIWPDDIYWVLHSSGSTGIPKAIPLTWKAVRQNAVDTIATLGLGTELLHVGSMSQCYANGLFNSFLLPLVTGGRAHLAPVATVASFGAYVKVLRESKADILWVNPTVVSVLARRVEPSQLGGVKALLSCTAPLSADVAVKAEQTLRRPVLQSYGLTETLIVSLEKPQRSAEREFSAGCLVGGRESAFVGSSGTLEIANGSVTPGYVRRSGSALMFELPDGVPGERFVSADRAEIDGSGRLHVLGRTTGVINVGGVKIGAEQLEEVLRRYPGVDNAVVVGVESRTGGVRPAALIETSAPLDLGDVGQHCVRALGRAARPMVVRTTPGLPITSNGKIDRCAAEALLRGACR